MATREVIYSKGENGYNAMIADFSEMFDWDTVDAPTGTPYTDFKKNCGDDTFIALRVKKPTSESSYPYIIALVSKNGTIIQSTESSGTMYVAYSYGNGFFASCCSSVSLPNEKADRRSWGVSSYRNIVSGETSWLAFCVAGGGTVINYDYQVFTKDTMEAKSNRWEVTKYAKIGGAVALHETATGCVSDKILMLTAIPDIFSACVNPVVFNGTPYTRLGHLLLPTS